VFRRIVSLNNVSLSSLRGLVFWFFRLTFNIFFYHGSHQLGDPTVGGNLHPCSAAMEAIVHAVLCKPHDAGYVNACGTPEAHQAIADAHSHPSHKICSDNVIVANGCSGALELALMALLDPGTAILVPRPGFPLYQVIAESHGAEVVHYNLLPDRNWECDLDHLEELMASHPNMMRAMLINNPSDPTGGVNIFFPDGELDGLHFTTSKYCWVCCFVLCW
jgi:aspartate/methionine/tyrosine aminotransferase